MESLRMICENGGGGAAVCPSAAVVSRSPLMRKRISSILGETGFSVAETFSPVSFLKHKRQRPYVICFFDARGTGGSEVAEKCFAARPGERYVIIADPNPLRPKSNGRCKGYGCLTDSFSSQDIVDWATRASAEERFAKGDQSLEEFLLGKFRSFSHEVGKTSMTNLHSLVMERVERPLFMAVLEWTGGNQSKASEILGLHRNTLRARLRALGL